MKKKVINNLIILEFVIFFSIVFFAVNLVLLANYFDKSSSYFEMGMIDMSNPVNLRTPELQGIAENSGQSAKIDGDSYKADKLQKQVETSYVSDLKTSPKDKTHRDLKKKIKTKKKDEDKVRVIIGVKDEKKFNKISKLVEEDGGDIDAELEIGNSIIANIKAGQIDKIAADEDVIGLWDDKEYNMLLDTGIYQINAPSAWGLGYNGAGVKIAVLDTGIDDTNEMLLGKVVAAEVFTGEDHAIDKQGHGTHIAGIIAGNGKYKGVAPGASLMNAKVLTDTGGGSTSTIIKGINWAVKNGTDVISMSLGGAHEGPDESLNAALREAIDAGVIVVISAGNCGEECPSGGCGSFRGITQPGDFEDAITVGAVDKSNNWACFSSGQEFNSYIKPDLVAPGVDITSSYLGNAYHQLSGTSMSAPFVSGVAALMLQKNSSLNQSTLKSLLENNAVDLGVEGKDVKFGSGLVDAKGLFLMEEKDINDTANQNKTQNKNFSNLLIGQDIGENWFIEKSEFSETEDGFYGAMAKYKKKEL